MRAPLIKRLPQLQQESTPADKIPYSVHLSDYTVTTHEREYLQVIELSGASFESADDEQLNNWHQRLNILLRSMASPHIALWQHIVRCKENRYPDGIFPEGFAKNINDNYARHITQEELMVNKLYLTVVYRPNPSKTGKALLNFLSAIDATTVEEERLAALDKMETLVSELMSSLDRYDPVRLGVYLHNGIYYSSAIEFFAFLVNNEWQRIPLCPTTFNKMITTSRPFFGNETIELRTPTDTGYSAMLGINTYPSQTQPGFLNELLIAPFSFVLTQSFLFLSKEPAKNALKRQRNRMQNTGDDAVSQLLEIDDALDDLQSNRFVMGEHHFSLRVQADSVTALHDNIALARPLLSDNGIIVAREDLALEAAFWAQLPANFKYRPRRAPITSYNFASFAPLHNFPLGRRTGNHWGDALTLLMTAAGTPYYFSFHASNPDDADGGSKKDVGHTLLIGPNGSGKTVFITFQLCMLQKFGVTSVLFTKDSDSAICIRALGGQFYAIKNGEPTGWNPFQLEPTADNTQFLNEFVRQLVSRDDSALSITEENEISHAIDDIMRFDKADRRLGRVADYLDKTTQDGIYTRLQQWCYARKSGEKDGLYAWLFDNPHDTLLTTFGDVLTTGFDVTDFLDRPTIRMPVNMWLFYITKRLIDGRRFALFIAEFWKSLADPYFADFAKDQLKTLRKKNGFVVLDSQSPSDAINHPISRTLIEQTATKIVFPNPDANESEYTKGLNLSEREYKLIKEEIPIGSRLFVIKQGHHCVLAKLDLAGFEEELAILSSRKHNSDYVEELIAEHGNAPEKWLPLFMANRRKA